MTTTTISSVSDDRLVGAEAIASWRKEKLRRTRYLLEQGLIPGAYREGRRWIGSKARLHAEHVRQAGLQDLA